MNYKKIVNETDIAYKQTFANMEERPWGYFFWNTENPTHYDANHAHILQAPDSGEMGAIIAEVIEFYSKKEIYPRFYLYDWENSGAFIEALKKHNFKIEQFSHPIQLWTQQFAQVAADSDILIEPVTKENYAEALQVECSITELGGKEVREKAFELEWNHPAFHHYLLKYCGVPASVACIFHDGDYVRVENVATLTDYRGKGLIGHLLKHLQEEFCRMDAKYLWVFPINARVEAVYQKYGFKTVEQIQSGHAYLGGKGINDIR